MGDKWAGSRTHSLTILGEHGKVDFGKFQPLVYDAADTTYRVADKEVDSARSVGKALI